MKKGINFLVFWIIFGVIACNQVNKAEIKNADGYLIETFEFIEDSIKHGLQTKFINNKINEEAYYSNGQLNGERKLFFDSGEVEIAENYVNGQIDGPYKVYYKNGQLHIDANYVNGKMQGKLKRYYETGELWEEVTMVDNEENGPFVEYHKNGKPSWKGQFLNGDNEFGELEEYNEEGVLIKRMLCDSMAVCQTIWTLEKGDLVPYKLQLSHELLEN